MKGALAAVAALGMLLAGCGGDGGDGDADARSSEVPGGWPVDEPEQGGGGGVDPTAPELRKLKQAAGLENCPAAQTTDGGLPGETLPCLGGGRAVDLSTLEGPVVLNFFWSGCEPCREEMPALQEFDQTYGDQVPIIGVDSMESYPGEALKLARETGATYPILADLSGELQGTELSVNAYPTFFLLDEDGDLSKAQGGLDSVDDVVEMVEKYLEVDLD